MITILIVDDDMATVDVICKSVNWSALHIDKVMTAYNIEKAKEILLVTMVIVKHLHLEHQHIIVALT